MTVVTTRPDSLLGSSGSPPVTGAATIVDALSDDSDSSYVTTAAGSSSWEVGFDEPVLPTGSLVTRVSARLRCAVTTASKEYATQVSGMDVRPTVNWTTPTTITLTPAGASSMAMPAASLDAWLSGVYALLVPGSGTGAIVQLKSYEAFFDVALVEQPEVAVSAPTGTITTTNKPLTSWANTLDSDGGAQSRYEVKVYSAAQYGAGGFDPDTSTPTVSSGQLSGAATSWQMTATLPDDTYRAYVRSGQTVNGTAHWSDWDYEGFVIDVAVPDAPALTVTGLDAHGCVQLDMSEQGSGPSTDAFELQRSLDGGLTWEPVRLPAYAEGGILPGDEATLYDYEAPNSSEVMYRVRALHDYDGTYAASDWTTEPGTWSSGDWWLKCPASPALNRVVNVHSQTGVQRRPRRGTFQPVGARYPVVVRTTRSSDEGPIVFRTDDDQAIDELLALADSGRTLLLQAPPTDHWPDRYVELGDADASRYADKAFIAEHLHAYQWTEVASPDDPVDEWPEFGS